MTGVGGLVPFGAFVRELGVDCRPSTAASIGSTDQGIVELEQMAAEHGLAPLRGRRLSRVHLEVDATVTPVFGEHEGTLPEPNPRCRGRPSYHPTPARIAETDTVVGAALRQGDTGFGGDDVPRIVHCLKRTREVVGPRTLIYVQIHSLPVGLPLRPSLAWIVGVALGGAVAGGLQLRRRGVSRRLPAERSSLGSAVYREPEREEDPTRRADARGDARARRRDGGGPGDDQPPDRLGVARPRGVVAVSAKRWWVGWFWRAGTPRW